LLLTGKSKLTPPPIQSTQQVKLKARITENFQAKLHVSVLNEGKATEAPGINSG